MKYKPRFFNPTLKLQFSNLEDILVDQNYPGSLVEIHILTGNSEFFRCENASVLKRTFRDFPKKFAELSRDFLNQ